MRYLPLLFALLIASCNNDDPSLRFGAPVPQIPFTIDAGLSTFDSHFYNFVDIPTRIDSIASSRNFNLNDAEAIRPAQARIEALFGGADYSFAREMSIRICSEAEAELLRNGEPEQCDREIFWRNPIPNNTGGQLDFVPNENNLKDALIGNTATFQLKIVAPLFRSPDQFIESRLLLEFAVF